MQELLDQLITPEVRMVLYLMVICVVMLYILSIVYVIRDAQRRGAHEIGKRFAVVIAVLGRSRGTAGNKDSRDVQAHDGHQHAGNDLVAVGDAHETVQ